MLLSFAEILPAWLVGILVSASFKDQLYFSVIRNIFDSSEILPNFGAETSVLSHFLIFLSRKHLQAVHCGLSHHTKSVQTQGRVTEGTASPSKPEHRDFCVCQADSPSSVRELSC